MENKFVATFAISKRQEVPSQDAQTGLKRYVEGYCVVADVIDEQKDLIEPSALQKAVEYLEKYTTVLFNHDPNRPIGKVVKAEVRDNRIWVRVMISEREDDIWTKIVEGVINAFSISGCVLDFDIRKDPKHGEVRIIKDFSIYEISLVTIPANPDAKTLVAYLAKALGEGDNSKRQRKAASKVSKFLNAQLMLLEVDGMWAEKVKKAVKALGVIIAKIEDEELKSALQQIQDTLAEALAEADDSYKYPEDQQQKGMIDELRQRVDRVEKELGDIRKSLEDILRKQADVDEVLGDLVDFLKQMYGGHVDDEQGE